MNSTDSFVIEALELGPMENFVYLISDRDSGRAAVVDPAWEVSNIIELAKNRGVEITDILLTHSHFDHINGIEKILQDHDAQVHILKQEAKFWGQFDDARCTHHGGDRIKLGSTEIEILHTPGHTPGSACYRLGNELITGDTLFVFGCGRCDLAGGDPHQMYHTLKKMGAELPSDICIHPGHNYAEKPVSDMAEQMAGNPFLHFEDEQAFVQYRMHDHDRTRNTPYHPVVRRK